jgi:hypothetical protein
VAFLLAAALFPARVSRAGGPSIANQPLGEPLPGTTTTAAAAAPKASAPATTAISPAAAPATPAAASSAPSTDPVVGIVQALDGQVGTSGSGSTETQSERDLVDQAIREALVLEHEGNFSQALQDMQDVVRATNLKDVKARYFLADAYKLQANAIRSTDPQQANQDDRMYLLHMRAAEELAPSSPFAEDAQWGSDARATLEARSQRTPVMDQNTAGGTYPYGYCGITALRMVLENEGLPDPGADAVALQGAAPYIPGEGSSGTLLAERAQQLGLTGATFTSTGDLSSIESSVDLGRPVMVAGQGPFAATMSDGSAYTNDYPDGHWLVVTGVNRDSSGNVTSLDLNDPNGGYRETMTPGQFADFFGSDGTVWDISYSL